MFGQTTRGMRLAMNTCGTLRRAKACYNLSCWHYATRHNRNSSAKIIIADNEPMTTDVVERCLRRDACNSLTQCWRFYGWEAMVTADTGVSELIGRKLMLLEVDVLMAYGETR